MVLKLNHFIDFRHEIVVRRTTFELKEAEQRAHILEGLKKALENIDDIIALIRNSNDPKQAKELLINQSSVLAYQLIAELLKKVDLLKPSDKDNPISILSANSKCF